MKRSSASADGLKTGYRAKAQRIRERAERIDERYLRTTIMDIARLYERMADQVEKLAKRQAPKGS